MFSFLCPPPLIHFRIIGTKWSLWWQSFKVPLYVSYRHIFNTPNAFWADLFKGKCLEWFSFTSCRVASASFALSKSHLCVLDWVGKRTRVSIKAAAQGEEQTEPQVKAVGLRSTTHCHRINQNTPLSFSHYSHHTNKITITALPHHLSPSCLCFWNVSSTHHHSTFWTWRHLSSFIKTEVRHPQIEHVYGCINHTMV